MKSIEIDLEVHKLIENERRRFDEPEIAPLRRLLGLDSQGETQPSGYKGHDSDSRKGEVHRVFDDKGEEAAMAFGLDEGLKPSTLRSWFATWSSARRRGWRGDRVTLPNGTLVRMSYSGRKHEGEIKDGLWIVDGKTFASPSGAAGGVALTKAGKRTRLDGWMYWHVLLPGEKQWKRLDDLRPKLRLEDLI